MLLNHSLLKLLLLLALALIMVTQIHFIDWICHKITNMFFGNKIDRFQGINHVCQDLSSLKAIKTPPQNYKLNNNNITNNIKVTVI